jgi:hypothetical protein
MTRRDVVYATVAAAICLAFATAGFPRPAMAGLASALILLATGAPRSGVIAGMAVPAGLVIAVSGQAG